MRAVLVAVALLLASPAGASAAGGTARCRFGLSPSQVRRVRLVAMQVQVHFHVRSTGTSLPATWDGYTTYLRARY